MAPRLMQARLTGARWIGLHGGRMFRQQARPAEGSGHGTEMDPPTRLL